MIVRRLLRALLPVPVALFVRRHWLARLVAGGKGYCERDVELLPQLVKRTDVCWDIGANSGMYAIPLARLCSQVFAFEPVPHSLEPRSTLSAQSHFFSAIVAISAVKPRRQPARALAR